MRKNIRKTAIMLCLAASVALYGCGTKQDAEDRTAVKIENSDNTDNEDQGTKDKDTKEKDTSAVSSKALNAAVKYSHESGFYEDSITLEITAATADRLFFTTDGSDPRTSATAVEYSEPLALGSREHDENVASAVDPNLFDTAHAKYKNGEIVSYAIKPSADAVDKCHVIKTALLTHDGSWSDVFCGTYFIGTPKDHIKGLDWHLKNSDENLAIVSITTDYDNLFDYEKGIYMKGPLFEESWKEYLENGGPHTDDAGRKLLANYSSRGREWERECHVEIMECDNAGSQTIISQSCGIRIQGNFSRSDLQKSFRLTARDEYGDKRFRYNVFGDNSPSSYKTLVLRNGGNSAFGAKFNDAFWQSLARDADLDVSTQLSRPAVVYLNGEYWGLYILQEDYSDEYFEDHYDVDSNDVIVYKGDAETIEIGYKLDIGEIPESEPEDAVDYYYRPLMDFFSDHQSLSDQASYDEFCTLVDPDSVRDYFAFECFINNKWDWPAKNWSMWKSKTVSEGNEYYDGRWRFCLYDTEFGGISGTADCATNTIKEDNYKTYGLLDTDTHIPAVLCFAYLMTNADFRQDFYARLNELNTDILSYNNATERLIHFENMYSPLLVQFFERYPGSGSREEAMNNPYYASATCIMNFLTNRSQNIQQMIDYCEETEASLGF